jgi:thiol-disulfide isomerase/thioredoxin
VNISIMKMIWIAGFVCFVFAFATVARSQSPSPTKTPPAPLVGPGTGAYTEDPKRILAEAAKAVANHKTFRYQASYRSVGAMTTRSPVADGTVEISRLDGNNPLKAKLAAKGIYFAAGSDDAARFHTTFNGLTVQRLRSKEKSVIFKKLSADDPRERTFGFVTSMFGGGPYQLLLVELLADIPFADQLSAPVIDYEGRTSVAGVVCHVIYIEKPLDPRGRTPRERWLIGAKDYLPRGYETLVSDNDGRFGAYVLTLSDLRSDIPLPSSTFSFTVPKGYTSRELEPPAPLLPLAVGEEAPEWRMLDARGVEHELSAKRGKIVVIDFWATWCGPCIRAMPELQRIYDRFKDRGVEVYGVNVWEESNAIEFMKRSGYTYGLLLNGEAAANSYRVPSLPTLYVIGRDGKIIRRTNGLDDGLENFLENQLEISNDN